MDKKEKTSWWQAHRPTTRRLVQLYAALLHNAYLKGFIKGEIYAGNAKYACVPGFNCYSCPGAVGACPLGSIQNALSATGYRAGWYVLGIILLYGVILGRTVCGWLCPLGLIQELLHKIPTPKIKKSSVTRALSWLKYVILAVFVIAIPLWYGLRDEVPLPAFCKYICPAGTFEGAAGHLANPANASMYNMLGILFTRKFVILLVIGLTCIFCYRSFCRFLCPLGAIYGLFNRFNIIGVKVDDDRCNHCGACVRSCEMDVRHVGDHECINCGKCMASCSQGAISIKAGSIVLKAPAQGCAGDGPEAPAKRARRGRTLWGAALAVLCAALLWFNVLDPAGRKESGSQQTTATVTQSGPSQPSGPQGAAPAAVKAGADSETEMASETEKTEEAVPAETEAPAAAETAEEAETAGTEAVTAETEAAPAETEAPAAAETVEETETAGAETAPVETAAEAAKTAEEGGNASAADYTSSAPIGHEVGNQLGDFTITCYDGSQFHLADTRGKITFINLWATHCTPCVNELPYFSDLYKAHEGDIAMLAVHFRFTTKDPVEFIADKGYAMPFATDTAESTVWDRVGGSGTLPQTIVLNRKGEVVYNQTGSVTPEKLEALYKEADTK